MLAFAFKVRLLHLQQLTIGFEFTLQFVAQAAPFLLEFAARRYQFPLTFAKVSFPLLAFGTPLLERILCIVERPVPLLHVVFELLNPQPDVAALLVDLIELRDQRLFAPSEFIEL